MTDGIMVKNELLLSVALMGKYFMSFTHGEAMPVVSYQQMKEEHILRYTLEELSVIPDETDWVHVEKMTDEEVYSAALSDPDAQPTDETFWQVDLMRQIVGPDAKVAAASQAKFTRGVEGKFQDVCQMLFVYPSGAGAIIEGNRLVPYESSDCRLKVVGSKGVVEINRFPDGLRILIHTGKGVSEVFAKFTLERSEGLTDDFVLRAPAEAGTGLRSKLVRSTHLLINVAQHILEGASLIVTTEDSLEASRLCIEATEIAQRRRETEFLGETRFLRDVLRERRFNK